MSCSVLSIVVVVVVFVFVFDQVHPVFFLCAFESSHCHTSPLHWTSTACQQPRDDQGPPGEMVLENENTL